MFDELIVAKSKNMDWKEASEIIERLVEIEASKPTAHGQSSSESIKVQAAWRRIQRG
tara:strand:- start:5 stop:175 length:171 start_codon:yes stop_codon:yes gene_type:complete